MCVYIQYNRYDCYFIWTAIISNYFLFPKFPFWLFLEKSFFLFLSRLMCMQLQCNKTRIKVACATLDKRASGATEKCHPEKNKKTKKRTGESASAIHIYGSNLIGASRPAPFAITTSRTPANRIRLSPKKTEPFFFFSFSFVSFAALHSSCTA